MNLTRLKRTHCDCGARVVSESQPWQHTNGQWMETQNFKCGFSIEWSPNHQSEITRNECPNSEGRLIFMAKRADAKTSLKVLISKIEVDEDFKNRVISSLEYL